MSPLIIGLLVVVALVVLLLAGTPVAFALGAVAMGFLLWFEGLGGLTVIAETFYSHLNEFTLLAVPMFILMGAAVASSRAGADLYVALDRWLTRVPGGLLVSNLGACGIFSALSGSSPATCAAIGKMGIPELRQRGYPAGLAAGAIGAGATMGILIPPSVTMIIYGVVTETSIGRLFAAGVLPGVMLTALFIAWSIFYSWRHGASFLVGDKKVTWRQRFTALPPVLPFILIVAVVLWALYGGVATPSEASGVGAFFSVLMVMLVYRVWRAGDLWHILRSTTMESVMIMMIIAASGLFAFMLSNLYVTQTLAESISNLEVDRWVLMAVINLFLLLCGLFLPPVAVILMTAPTLLPIVLDAGFDPIWFGVVMTINLEIGLITPPVGLNLYVLNAIAPDVELPTILWGALPFMLCMVVAIILLCLFPSVATWLPDTMMGARV